jgi:hypothetical protein
MTIPEGVTLRPQDGANGTAPAPAASRADGGLAALPPSGTKRWVIRRKAAVVNAVRTGLLSLDEACQRYHLSVEEFLSWQRLIEKHGVRGLRATRLQDYRAARALQSD